MGCPREGLLIRFVSQELSPTAAAEVREHLACCPACHRLEVELSQLWGILGSWTIQPPDRDKETLISSVMTLIDTATAHERRRERSWISAWRAAAAILLAAGLGMAAGALVPVRTAEQRTVVVVKPQVVLEELGASDFAVDSATGLTSSFEPSESSQEDAT